MESGESGEEKDVVFLEGRGSDLSKVLSGIREQAEGIARERHPRRRE